jgi:tRNA-specific 2-thiouridylase
MARVVLAMSGGVDSSVAAWLLREQGHEVIGVFMRHGHTEDTPERPTAGGRAPRPGAEACRSEAAQGDSSCLAPTRSEQAAPLRPRKQGCCTAADAADARRVADMLGIPFYAVNFEEEFGRIVDYFVEEYLAGRTPNPCIACNTWIKFGKLFDYADGVGARFVATGHYARILHRSPGETPLLLRGVDPTKDQSYALFGIRRALLDRLCLPVGEYAKTEIRRMAAALGLRVADKPDSQEICFVPGRDHARFVRAARPEADTSGEIVTTEGDVVGWHSGLERFTVGQRKGLGVAFGERRYVVRLEPKTRRVVVGEIEALKRSELVAANANWLIDPPKAPFACHVKIRYRSPAMEALVEPLEGNRFRVRFRRPCLGVAPGQAAVCYAGDRVLGGGWIE